MFYKFTCLFVLLSNKSALKLFNCIIYSQVNQIVDIKMLKSIFYLKIKYSLKILLPEFDYVMWMS